ncbi:IS1182 family transposase [Flavobacterium granuli]|uniref:Transposase n=1 Tax=Flavobacterium granuli TaxID=280093 RepID=A0A1M5UDQ1_9FLAO|nr:IS1182 family transposase [Flavobacterium granuli]PRZ19123.1 transposase [Flavobacterium granuli]SHH61164.1 Transposase [Flavobacterium granuli]
MQHITGTSRHQMRISSLEDSITADNQVRFIDAFVEFVDLSKLGFAVQTIKEEGRPSYNTKVFLKIYLYGYLNGIRSGRKLENECFRNIEMQWLLEDIRPNYHSISDFRKNNPVALKNVFKLFVSFLKDADLIAGETIAIDGTKSRAHNSKKANFNQKKIDKHLEYIEVKTQEYLDALEENDAKENPVKIQNIQQKIERLKQNKLGYEQLEEKLKASGEPQISTTDNDARALLVQGQVVEISFNMQAAVDAKHNLVVATHTINRNDRNALSAIAIEAKENLAIENYTALVDKGYHNGREIEACKQANITTIVAQPEQGKNKERITENYLISKFQYDQITDTYTCPQGETLKTTGSWHKKTTDRDSYKFKRYRTPKCRECPVKHLCTSRMAGRDIDRSQYADAVEENNKRYHENSQLYRKRQEINEHIFGTIKRQWGYNHTNLTGLEKVNGEHSLIMLVYNIKRSINILGVPDLIAKLKKWNSPYKAKVLLLLKKEYLKLNSESLYFSN